MHAGPIAAAGLLVYPIQLLRLTLRGRGPLRDRLVLSYFQVLARFPEAFGQLRFQRDRLLGRAPTLIEHKVNFK
jgi:hypothetical protein